MNKNLKLGLGVLLLGTAIFLIYKKTKDKKEKPSQDPICKDGEELVTEMVNIPCQPTRMPNGMLDTSNCKSIEKKVCKPKSRILTDDLDIAYLQESQKENFSGY